MLIITKRIEILYKRINFVVVVLGTFFILINA